MTSQNVTQSLQTRIWVSSSVGTTSSSPTLKSRSSANGEASTTVLRLCHCGGLRLVVSRAHSAVSTGTAMALAIRILGVTLHPTGEWPAGLARVCTGEGGLAGVAGQVVASWGISPFWRRCRDLADVLLPEIWCIRSPGRASEYARAKSLTQHGGNCHGRSGGAQSRPVIDNRSRAATWRCIRPWSMPSAASWPPGRQVHARKDRPPGDTPEHQGPGPPAGPREP